MKSFAPNPSRFTFAVSSINQPALFAIKNSLHFQLENSSVLAPKIKSYLYCLFTYK
ncbi:MAG: hypothetical protein ACERIH_00795 [Labilibaculum antarcticum]